MGLEVGMYVKTKNGIGQIDETRIFMEQYFQFHLDSNKGSIHNVSDNTYWNKSEDVIGKPSNNLMSLIRPGDYVNGDQVERVTEFKNGVIILEFDEGRYINYVNGIKDIMTKEQYEKEKYVVKK